MERRRGDGIELQFGDIVKRLIRGSGLTEREFCNRFDIVPAELSALLVGKRVDAGLALRVAAVLEWKSSDIDRFFTQPGTVHAGSDALSEPGPYLQAYADPATCALEEIRVVRPHNFDQEFAERHLVGRGWVSHYSDEYVEVLEKAIRSAGRREPVPAIWGVASDSSPGVGTFRRVGALVQIRYDIHEPHIHPIEKVWCFASVWRGGAQGEAGN
jgi:hypothetical protein